ncbi:tetratricopeptide repeat protein [Streptomyces sp. NPDC057540]|uniref:tetratricopeptide repeat protein n=1 Tax=Streptomyces sp. NPDC057540 TaxID=3346160 RepID=UPI0036CD3372
MTGRADASGDRSVAAGGNIGKVVTGDFSTQIENGVILPGALPVPDSGLVHLPERTALFVGRARELARLDAGAPSGVQVLCGLGGIGKSTLAAHWAEGRLGSHHPVWWITAETAGELDAGLAALARAMQPAHIGVLPDDALRERALQWLAGHDDWLLILDNVSDPADVKPLLARATGGRVLITTRRATGWQDIAETIAVPELDPEEAAALFTRVCPGDGVAQVCAELGHLPLALRQAAAYCAEAGITPRAYLDLLARYPAETYALTTEGGEAARTVSRVWQVTLDRLADTPLAGRILSVLAWWAPEEIPRHLLSPLGSPLEVTDAVRRLRAHSMIGGDGDSLTVHRLVQAVVRSDRGGRAEAGALLIRVLRALPSLEGIMGDLGRWRSVAAQAEALARHTEVDEDSEAWTVLFEWAASLFAISAPERSLFLGTRALLANVHRYGLDDERVLRTMRRVTWAARGTRGFLALAEILFPLHLRAYGPDDPRTIEARASLAEALPEAAGDRADALRRENVERAVRSLGEDARETIEARRALIRAGGDPQAVVTALESLRVRARNLSPDAYDLVQAIEASLVPALLITGRSERALEVTGAAVDEALLRFGTAHPETMARRGHHVVTLSRAGETDRARTLARELIGPFRNTVGEGQLLRMIRQVAEGLPSNG